MGFSERMRDSLGAEGARVSFPEQMPEAHPGGEVATDVHVEGGTRPAQIDALILRVIEARRHWHDANGNQVAEAQAAALPDRSHLRPAWSRRTVVEQRLDLNAEVGPGEARAFAIRIPVPEDCGRSAPDCAITVNAQADIKGQIDPTGNGNLRVI